jgi:chromatin segregation and condensation protein Rec8/ScpA/Scc1 (kleisin family)
MSLYATPDDLASGSSPDGSASPYAVKLALFEGPLDLLLHLIRVNEVEITDIPIARISEQYLAMLETLRELDLDVAGEFLLMAATLAWIKSRMLLPPDGVELEGEGPDPRAELVARLLEYQRFKQAAGDLASRRWLGRDVFEAHVVPQEPRPEAEREIEVGLFQLREAYRRVLARAGPSATPHEVTVETVTTADDCGLLDNPIAKVTTTNDGEAQDSGAITVLCPDLDATTPLRHGGRHAGVQPRPGPGSQSKVVSSLKQTDHVCGPPNSGGTLVEQLRQTSSSFGSNSQ